MIGQIDFEDLNIYVSHEPVNMWKSFDALAVLVQESILKIMKNIAITAQKDPKIHTDDTTLPVQDRTLKGRTRTGRMWVYTNQSGCVYEYTSTRSREGPSTFLEGYQGIIQADGYSGYNECCEKNDIQRSGCWAHVRRKFYDVSQLLNEAGKKSKPILKEFKTWLTHQLKELLPQSNQLHIKILE